jgi:hypothetical protein
MKVTADPLLVPRPYTSSQAGRMPGGAAARFSSDTAALRFSAGLAGEEPTEIEAVDEFVLVQHSVRAGLNGGLPNRWAR